MYSLGFLSAIVVHLTHLMTSLHYQTWPPQVTKLYPS